MTAGLRVVALSDDLAARWDACALAWDTAWFWQTTTWIAWATAIAGEAFVSGQSFVLVNSAGDVVGLCPLNIEVRGGERTFAFLGAPTPAPAFDPALTSAERDLAAALYVQTLASIAQREGVTYGSLKMPFTGVLSASHLAVNPWLSHGYFDLPYLTQIVDLRKPESELWSDMRKGHRSDVKKASQRATAHIWDATTLTDDILAQYRALHAKDAGRVTRSHTTFDMMAGWIRQGHAVLAEARADGQPVAFAVIICYKTGAFYASGCRDPERMDVPGSHLVQWEAMRWLKQRGCALYDVGLQWSGPQWFYAPTPKEVSIAAYKRGFGGQNAPLVTAERFYSAETMTRTFATRVQTFVAATGLEG